MKPSYNKLVKLIAFATALVMLTHVWGCAKEEPAETNADTVSTETVVETTEKPTVSETATLTEATETESPSANSESEKTDEMLWYFEANDLKGETVNQSILAENKVTLVNVWATFCPPCLEEMPDLALVAQEYADKEVGFMGIVSDISEDDPDETLLVTAEKMVKDANIQYTNILASESIISSILAGVSAVPTTFFVDSQGQVVGKVVVGSMTIEQMRENIEIALGEVSTP